MGKDREKEIKYLIYLKNQIIEQQKKEIKWLREELRLLELMDNTKVKKKTRGVEYDKNR